MTCCCTCVAPNIDPCKLKTPELSDTSSLIGSSGIISAQYKQPQAASSPSAPFFLHFLLHVNSEECESNSRLEKLVKSVPPPEDLRTDRRKNNYVFNEPVSKIASSFSFCKGAVTRLPLKCDRSTMGRDLEEVQWHCSFCLLTLTRSCRCSSARCTNIH